MPNVNAIEIHRIESLYPWGVLERLHDVDGIWHMY